MKYIKQFDSVRGIAVLFIIVYHWVPAEIFKAIPIGFNVVDVFFVLSGFLITRILLESKNKAYEAGIKTPSVFANFFVRRALRIFPIYYLLIFLVLLIDHIDKTKLAYLLTYTFNFYSFNTQQWDDNFAHLWSLSVEEQFYLFWPWIILLVNKKYIPHVILICTAVGIITEYIFRNNVYGQVIPFTCLDSLGIGAFLSWIFVTKPFLFQKAYRVSAFAAAIFVTWFCLDLLFGQLMFLPTRLTLSAISAWLISYIVYKGLSNKKNNLGFMLNNKILINVGKMSYGIYVYHFALPNYSWHVFLKINSYFPAINNAATLIIENFILLMFVSWLSYNYFELPITKLKKYFALAKKDAPVNKTTNTIELQPPVQ
ncbi:MAG TPA: acyltransferase [Flavisolibacter sp.]|nr:acyltransferase [Flavisolibacter sp.]